MHSKQLQNFKLTRLSLVACLLLLSYCPNALAQNAIQYTDEDLEVSYIYAAILGTGTYQIKGRRLTMLRLPFRWSKKDAENTPSRLRWLLPVVLGYDDLDSVDSDIIDALLPNKLVTLTFLPGVEYRYPVSPKWEVKPFIQAGVGRDFSIDEAIFMTQLGVRSLNLYEPANKWEIRWGNTLRWAAEYQVDSEDQLRLSIFETGLDVRYDLPIKILKRRTNTGIYYIYQRLIPKWTSSRTTDYRADARSLNEIGISVGLKTPHTMLGIDVQRLRAGYKTGGSFEGWTLGTSFPF